VAGGKNLRRQRQEADRQIDGSEDARLRTGVVDRGRYDMRLLEIENGRRER